MEKHGEYVRSEEGDSPLILFAPHSAEVNDEVFNRLPDFVKRKHTYEEDEDARMTIGGGRDVAVDSITDFHNQKDHTRIWTTMPRGFVDICRSENEVDGLSVEGRGDPKYANGTIWRSTVLNGVDLNNIDAETLNRMKSMLKEPYTEEEYQKLLDLAYRPSIEAVRQAIQNKLKEHGHAIIVSPHSFPANTARLIETGEHTGNYIIGSPAQRASKSTRTEQEFFDIVLKEKKMPDVITISNPQICNPIVPDKAREKFEEKGYIVSNGAGPFSVTPERAKFTQGNAKNNVHFMALEHVAFDNLEPDRLLGAQKVNDAVAARFRPIYQRIFDRLANLTTEELRVA